MPKFTVTDPASGKKLTFNGDVPPSPEHVAAALAQLNAPRPSALAENVSAVVRPTLEIGGALAGGALMGGASAPTFAGVIPGAMVGGAGGFALGKSGADLVDRGLGIKKPIGSLKEAVSEAAGTVLEGVESEATGLGVTKALGGALKLGKGAAKKTISSLLGPTQEEIAARAANPDAIKNAKPIEGLAQSLSDSFQAMSDKISEMSDDALSHLSASKYLNDGAATKTSVLAAVRKESAALGRTVSDSTAHAKKVLGRYAERLRKLGSTVSEKEIGSIIREIDNDIDWASKELMPLNNALEGLRTRLDKALKAGNKAYAKAMEPVAENTRLLKRGQKIFGIENDIGKGFKPTNMTATALASSADPRRLDSRAVLKQLKDLLGRDYITEAQAAKVAEAFKPGAKAGSKKVNVGAILGAALGTGVGSTAGIGGGMTGAVGGAVAGGLIDANAGPIAGSTIDTLVKLSNAQKRATTPTVKSMAQTLIGALTKQNRDKK